MTSDQLRYLGAFNTNLIDSINKTMANGIHPSAIIGILECCKMDIRDGMIRAAQVKPPTILPAHSLPRLPQGKHD